jgi:uncharacterized membrane protein YbhN (UPF0104 family)
MARDHARLPLTSRGAPTRNTTHAEDGVDIVRPAVRSPCYTARAEGGGPVVSGSAGGAERAKRTASRFAVSSGRARIWALRALRAGVTVLAFAWVLGRVDMRAVGEALARVPLHALAAALALTLVNVAGLGTLRWRALLASYGAPCPPPLAVLAQLNLIGWFYNTWLPGGVGGDVVRGVASRRAFGDEEDVAGGATRGVAVVFVERTLGLVGLLVLSGGAALLSLGSESRTAGLAPGLLAWSALGVGAGIAAIAALALGRWIAGRLPGRLAQIARSLPAIVAPLPFALACGISVAIHALVALLGHLVIASLDPGVALAASLLCVPIAMATQFLPITIGGAGAREMAFAVLYGAIGVAEADAVAASLVVFFAQLAIGAIGGLLPMPAAGPRSSRD